MVYAMQAPLAALGFIAGVLAGWLNHNGWFIVGGLLMLANWPWTIFAVMPINRRLKAIPPDHAGAASRQLIIHWNRLHMVRTLFGALTMATFLARFALRSP